MVNEKIKAAEENLIHVYNRFPIALDQDRKSTRPNSSH